MLSLKKAALVLFLSISVLGIQMVRIERPYFGHFSSYQIVSAFMARNMMNENFSQILLPKTDFMIGKKKSLPLNQYPFHSLIAALGAKVFGGTLEFWGRFQAVVFNAGSIVLVGLICAILFSSAAGWIAASLMALSPFSLIYGQMFMSEASSLFFMLLALLILLQVLGRNRDFGPGRLMAAGLSLSVALTGRIHFLLFMPVFVLIFWLSPRPLARRVACATIFSAFALLLPVAWYAYTYFVSIHADNVHTNLFLQLGARKIGDENYLLDLNYYRHVLDIFTEKMLNPAAFGFLPLGLILLGWHKREGAATAILAAGLVSGTLTAVLFPQKVMDHEFYLYGVFPFCVIITACGLSKVFEKLPVLSGPVTRVLLLVLYLAVSARYFSHPIYKYPERNEELIPLAEALRAKTRPDDWIVIASRGFSELKYYSERLSWDISFHALGKEIGYYFKDPRFSNVDLEERARLERAMRDPVTWLDYLMSQGASYLVVPSAKELEEVPKFRDYLYKHFSPVPLTEHSLFFKLSERAG